MKIALQGKNQPRGGVSVNNFPMQWKSSVFATFSANQQALSLGDVDVGECRDDM